MAFPKIDQFDRQVALVVGIDRYGNGLRPLENAVADASRIERLLADRHGYRVIRVPESEATRAGLEGRVTALAEEVGPRSQLLVYFAGHGVAQESDDGLDGFLLPVDAEQGGGNWLPMSWLRERLGALPCHHLLLVLDCCFAGAFRGGAFRDSGPPGELHQQRFEHYLRRGARLLLASCAHDERALDRLRDTSRASPFAATLVEALGEHHRADGNHDGVVTAADLYGFVRDQLAPAALGGFRQTPNLWPLPGHDVGEYLFRVTDRELSSAEPITAASNPYRGLDYFTAAQASLFKGRGAAIAELMARVRAARLTVLLGSSGSGKSSLLHAGLVPALGAAGIAVLGPLRIGREPLQQLAALVEAPVPDGAGSICAIVDQWDELLDHADGELFQLLVAGVLPAEAIDRTMLDERLAAARAELRPLVERIRAGLARFGTRIALVIAVRSDTEPHFVTGRSLGAAANEAWQHGRMFLRPMNREELRQCIEEPASERVVFFDSTPRADGKRLVDAILDEVDQTPGALPLLSVALQRMFADFARTGRPSRTIEWSEYPKEGGVTGALQAAAEHLYRAPVEGGPEQQAAHQATFHRVLVRMVALRGTEAVRRAVSSSELEWSEWWRTAPAGGPRPPPRDEDEREDERVERVLAQLEDARLTVVDAAPEPAADRRPRPHLRSITPRHDALLVGWPTLKLWIAADRERIGLQRVLTQAADEWTRTGAPSALWDGDELARLAALEPPAEHRPGHRLRRWLTGLVSTRHPIDRAPRHTFTLGERRFIIASLRALLRRRLIALGVVAATIAVLAIAAIVTYRQRNQARESAAAEKAAKLRAEDAAIRANDRVRLRAASAALVQGDPTAAIAVLSEVERPDEAVGWRDLAARALGQPHPIARFDRGGQRLTVVDDDHVLVDDLRGGTLVFPRERRAIALPGNVTLSPDRRHALVSTPGELQWLDLRDAAPPKVLARGLRLHEGGFSPDGTRALVRAEALGRPTLVSGRDGAVVATLDCGDSQDAAFVGDAAVVTFGGTTTCLWRDDGRSRTVLDTPPVKWVRSSRAGDRLLTMTDAAPHDLRLWDLRSGTSTPLLDDPEAWSTDAVITPDGSRVVLWTSDQAALWATGPDRRLATWSREPALVVEVSSDGRRLAIAGHRESRLIDVGDGHVIATLAGGSPTFSADGTVLSTVDQDAFRVRTFEADSGAARVAIEPWFPAGDPRRSLFRRLSSDGRFVVVATANGLSARDTRNGRELAAIPGPVSIDVVATADAVVVARKGVLEVWKVPRASEDPPGRPTFAADHRHAVVTTADAAMLWDLDRWRAVTSLPASFSASFAPDGGAAVITSSTGASIIDTATGTARALPCPGVGGSYSTDVRWSDDGARVAITERDVAGCLIDARGGALLRELDRGMVVAPDGRTVASVVEPASVRVCAAEAGGACHELSVPAVPLALAFTGGGGLVTLDARGVLRLLDAATGALRRERTAWRACRRDAPPGSDDDDDDEDWCRRMPDPSQWPPELAAQSTRTARLAMVARNGDVFLWDTATGVEVPVPCRVEEQRIRFTPDGRRLLVDGCVIDGDDGHLIARFDRDGAFRLDVSPGGRYAVTVDGEGRGIRVHTLPAGERLRDQDVTAGGALDGFALDDSLLIEHDDRELRVWPVPSLAAPIVRIDLTTSPLMGRPIVSADRRRLVYVVPAPLDERLIGVPLAVDDLRRELGASSFTCLTALRRRELLEEGDDADAAVAACWRRAAMAPVSMQAPLPQVPE